MSKSLNDIEKPVNAPLRLACYATTANSFSRVYSSLYDNVPDAIKAAHAHWKEISNQFHFMHYRIFQDGEMIASGKISNHTKYFPL